jgi:hypothetical protein
MSKVVQMGPDIYEGAAPCEFWFPIWNGSPMWDSVSKQVLIFC